MEEIIPESLSIFSRPPTLLSIDDYSYEQVNTKTTLSHNITRLEFTVPADKQNYTDLRETYILIKVRYVKADDTAINATPVLGPVNYPVTSMIKSITMAINDTRVTPNDNNAAYIHFLHAFTQGHDAKSSYLTAGLYYEDTMTNAATMDQSDPRIVNPDNGAPVRNEGLAKRTSFFANGKDVMLLGKLYIPPHNTTKLYLPHLKFDYTMEMAPFEFWTMSAGGANAHKAIINEAKLLVRRVGVSDAVKVAHEQLLQKRNAVYPLKYIQTKMQTIPMNSFSYNWENVFMGGEMPSAIFVGFVKSSAYQGSLTENPFYFQNVDLTSLTVHLGSKKIPNIEIKNNIGQNISLLSFWETLMSMDMLSSNMGPGGFDRTSFELGAFLLGFDLSRDGNPNALYSNSNYKAGNLALEMNFGTMLPTGFTVIVFALMQGELEINSNHQASTTY